MAKRKTVQLSALVEAANSMIAATPNEYKAQREGIAALIEWALMDSDNYGGYSYLRSEIGENMLLRPGYDSSRRTYYTKIRGEA